MQADNDEVIQPGRRLAINLGLAALLVASGCATLRQGSELDAAPVDLRDSLDAAADGNSESIRLLSIAGQIELRGRELIAEHELFIDSFDQLMKQRDVTSDILTDLITAHSDRRQWLRNDLLALQEELHQLLSPDEWQSVVKALNRTGRKLGQTGIRGR